LRVLHLEGNEADRSRVRQAIVGRDIDCEFVYASGKSEFAAALDREHFDLILSDFAMKGYDGSSAFALAREKHPEVPFLFVSGATGDAGSIEHFESEANDYVSKDHLELLLPAVRRCLSEFSERARRGVAESALVLAKARFSGVFEPSLEGMYEATPEGQLLDVNQAMAELCGYSSPTEFRANVHDINELHVNRAQHADFIRLLKDRPAVQGHESQIRRKDGSIVWISENARTSHGAHGELLNYFCTLTDITSRRSTEEALRESEERFREMASHVDEVFYIAELGTGRWQYVSPAFVQIWGRTLAELYAQPTQWTEAVVPEDRGAVLKAREDLPRGKECRLEYRIRRPDGTLRSIEDRSYIIPEPDGRLKRAAGVATDITRRRQLEGQLQQAQKMEAVGQLAGGVAHDFNNVLTVVIGFARLLLDRGNIAPDTVGPLTQIFNAGTRAANLTRQLLVFSRKQTVNRIPMDVNRVASEISEMLCRLIGEHITLRLSLAASPCVVEGDAVMIEQVLMNLAVNARDAMPGGGKLEINTEHVFVDAAAAGRHPPAAAGKYICLSVRDSGCGIPGENLIRIFEPFFTTKDAGRGTGLGLAMVTGIVQQHLGWIELESAVGSGTCFRILLPAIASADVTASPRHQKIAAANRGSETMLLVEDDSPVRDFAVAVLSNCGYRVLQACSGIDALEVWRWHKSRISLLFTDLVLPDGLGGVELAARLRKEKPNLRVVLTSGYADETIGEEFRPPPGTHFIHKPYKPQILTQTVRDALDDHYDR
jgi:two-component system cell cycle sensor histidine kinase/response regulator CckA